MGFRPVLHKTACSTTEDGLVEAWHFGFRTKRDCTKQCGKNKVADQLRGYSITDLRLCFLNFQQSQVFLSSCKITSCGNIFFFILISTEHETYPAHKCLNAIYCWHLNIHKQDKLLFLLFRFKYSIDFGYFNIYEYFNFHVQLS